MLRIGHRGACGHAPENTMSSVRKALELGVDGFEFDIQMSKDGVPVVIHDDRLERTTNGAGFVHDYTLAELKCLDAGLGEKIPTLQEVIDFVDKRCSLFVELKAENSVVAVAEIIKRSVEQLGWGYEQFFVVSFDHGQLLEMKNLLPEVRTGALFVGIPVELSAIAKSARAWSINPCIEHINKKLVDDAHKNDIKVLVWTVNGQHQLDRAVELGVDGVFSNFPEKIR